MSRSELRAYELFNALNLRNEDEEVIRSLMIMLLSIPKEGKKKKLFTERFAGKWQGDDSAEDINAAIRGARTLNREIEL